MIEVFEGIGQNPEFGRVAAALGADAGRPFRGVYGHDVDGLTDALEAALRGRFAALETLMPGLANATQRTHELLAELARAQKIFVYTQHGGTSDARCRRLFSALRKFGPNRLLAVGLANEWHPPGTVELVEDGLYRGYLARVSPEDQVEDIDLAGWTELLENTLLLAGQPLEEPVAARMAARPVERFTWVEAVHPHWRGRLRLSRTDDAVMLEEHQSLGRYRLEGGDLRVFWDKYEPDHFIADAAGVFVHEALRAGAPAAAAAPPVPSQAGPALDHPARMYDGAGMADPPADDGLLEVLEEPRQIPRNMPAFVADLSGRGLALAKPPLQQIHGSYLVRRQDVLLFGPNNLVSPAGYWSCEARSFKEQFLAYLQQPFYDTIYPGVKPLLAGKATRGLRTAHMQPDDTLVLDRPVFLATPLEPPIWARWLVTVAPKVVQFKRHGAGRAFFCFAALDWQKAFLQSLGVQEHEILQHDPGRTYLCRDLMTVEYSVTNFSISQLERANFFEIINRLRVRMPPQPKLFVSRLSRSRDKPNYRVLQNEAELAAMMAARGFALVEPEKLSFAEQVSLFAGAREVVCVGGSGLFNVVFCAPGTRVVTIESSAEYIGGHTELLASLELEYGVIFGEQDLTDPTPSHKRWTLDLPRAMEVLDAFFGGGSGGIEPPRDVPKPAPAPAEKPASAPPPKPRPGLKPGLKRASFTELAKTRQTIFDGCEVQLPRVCVYQNIHEFDAKYAERAERELYAARKVPFKAVELVALPAGTVVHGNLSFVTTFEDVFVAEQVPPWVNEASPENDALQSTAPVIAVDEPALLVARFGHMTWGHWLGELLPRAIAAEAACPGKFKFVVPAETTDRRYSYALLRNILGSLEAYGIADDRLIRIEKENRYAFSDLHAVTPMWVNRSAIHPGALNLLRTSLRVPVPSLESPVQSAALLRLRETGRPIQNATEVFDFLKIKGFQPFDIGNLPFIEQVGLFQRASSLFGTLGSGFTGLIYAPEGVKVVSAAPGGWFDAFFHGLAQAQSGVYADVRGAPEPDAWLQKAPFTLSVTRVAEALEAVGHR